MGFDVRLMHDRRAKRPPDHERGLAQPAFDIAAHEPDPARDVAGPLVVRLFLDLDRGVKARFRALPRQPGLHQRSARIGRGNRIHQRRKRIELRSRGEPLQPVRGGLLGLRHDHRHRIAGESHLSAGQQASAPHVRHRVPERKVVRREHGDHPGDRAGGRHGDPPNPGVRVRTQEEAGVEQPAHLLIRDELRAAGDFLLTIDPRNRLSNHREWHTDAPHPDVVCGDT